MIPFDETDAEWNELCSKWMDYVIGKFKERGIYDQILDLCGFNHESIQPSEPTMNFEELYGYV